MKSYVVSIITVSVISGIISAILPNGISLKKQINFITGLICAFVLIFPVVTVAKNAEILTNGIEDAINSLDISNSIDKSNSIIIEAGTEQIANGVKNALISKFKFKDESISVSIKINDDNIEMVTLEEITVTLKKEATWTDSAEVKEYLEDLVGCPVKIVKV